MLILETTRAELLKPLQLTSGIIERRHTMPILSNVYIESKNGQVGFIGTDLEIQMHTLGPKVGKDSAFVFTTNIRKLLEILRALPDLATIKLSLDQHILLLRSGKGSYNLQILEARDYPLMKVKDEVRFAFSVKQRTLCKMLSLIQYAMATQDIRYFLMGVLIQVVDKQLRMVATDGHRLAYTACEMAEDLPNLDEVIIPRKTVLELYKLLDEPDNLVTLELLTDKIRFSTSKATLISKVIDGRFPNYKSVIPKDNPNYFVINRQQLLAALERVSILANEKLRGVNLFLHPDLMTISCTNNEQELAQEELEISYQGKSLDLGFNIIYLLDVLRSAKSEEVRFAFANEKSSALVTIPDDLHFKYVVMPMKI